MTTLLQSYREQVKPKLLLIIGVVIGVLLLFNPFAFNGQQQLIFLSLLFIVYSWATKALPRTPASLLLLILFALFGNTPATQVFSFAWSPTLFLIVTTSLLSVALSKNTLIRSWMNQVIRYSKGNLFILLALPYVFGFLLIPVIPQAFARGIILGTLFHHVLSDEPKFAEVKKIMLLNVFVAISITYMAVSNGDIVLNHAILAFSGEAVDTALQGMPWITYMAVPTIIFAIISPLIIRGLFQKDLAHYDPAILEKKQVTDAVTKADKIGLAVILLVFLGWMFEPLHGISAWIICLIALPVLFYVGILTPADKKAVNLDLLIFLIAAFSIGRVIQDVGISERIVDLLTHVIPSAQSIWFLPSLILVIMGLHMVIGSAIATGSVALPILIPLVAQAGYDPIVITLILYITVNMHYLLPFHHATMMIGIGQRYYHDQHMFKHGLFMTVGIFILILGIFLPWWKFTGLL